MVYDATDPWAVSAGPVIRDELEAAGLDTTLLPVDGATMTGQVLAAGFADLALLPVNFTPYLSQMVSWYTTLLGPAGKNGSQDWTGYSSSQFDQLVETASQQLNPNTAAGYYAQADTHALGRHGLPSALRRTDGRGVEPEDRWGDADAPQRQPPVVRPAVGRPGPGVHQQHDTVAAGPVGPYAGRLGVPGSLRWAGPTRYDLRTLHCSCKPVGVAE